MRSKFRSACAGILLGINFSILGRSNADLLDDAMADALNTYNVRGASIAYFNRVSEWDIQQIVMWGQILT